MQNDTTEANERVPQDTALMRALLLRLSADFGLPHALSVAASVLANVLITDLPEVYGSETAQQMAEHVLDKLRKDVRERAAGVQHLSIKVTPRQ